MEELLWLTLFWGYSAAFSVLIRWWKQQRLFWAQWVVALFLFLIAWGLPYRESIRVVIWCIGCVLFRVLIHSSISSSRLLQYSLIYFNCLMLLVMFWAVLNGDLRVMIGIGIPAVWVACLGWRRLIQGSAWGRGAV
ncbi:MAG: hypothetical protein WHV66_03750 [Anaerolineales bacterium]